MRYKYFKYLETGLLKVLTIQTIMFTRLLVGLYYNGSSNIVIRVAARLYCAFCVIIVLLKNYQRMITLGINSGIFGAIIAFTSTLVINFIYEGENLTKFLNKIRRIDDALGLAVSDEIPISRIIFIFVLIHKLIIFGTRYFLQPTTLFNFWTGLLLSSEIALCNFTRIIMFEALYRRMKVLRKRFERDLSAVRRFEEGEVILIRNLRRCMVLYKNLMDTVHETDTPMKLLILLDILFAVPRYLIIIYAFMTTASHAKLTLAANMMGSIMPFIPGIVSELVSREVDEIRLCVIKQLLVCRAAKSRDRIKDAVKFFKYHPFRYTIWRLMTIDLTLIVSTVGLITTYTVAMIQFAHFY